MALQNGIQQRTDLHGAAANVEPFHLKGDDLVVAGKVHIVQFYGYVRHGSAPSNPPSGIWK